MRKYSATLIGASAFALFHFIVVCVPVLTSHANGEGQGMLSYYFDLPLGLLVYYLLPHGGSFLYDTPTSYTLYVCVGGTLMYAAVGALIGWIIGRTDGGHPEA